MLDTGAGNSSFRTSPVQNFMARFTEPSSGPSITIQNLLSTPAIPTYFDVLSNRKYSSISGGIPRLVAGNRFKNSLRATENAASLVAI